MELMVPPLSLSDLIPNLSETALLDACLLQLFEDATYPLLHPTLLPRLGRTRVDPAAIRRSVIVAVDNTNKQVGRVYSSGS